MNRFESRLIIAFCGIIGFGAGFIHSHRHSGGTSPGPLSGSPVKAALDIHMGADGTAAGFEPMAVDPLQALQHASLYVSSLHRQFEMVKLSATLSSDDFRRLLASLGKEDSDSRGLLLQLWAEKDPGTAASYAAGLPSEGLGYYLGAVFRVWARRDVAAAYEGSLRLPPVSRLCALQEIAASYLTGKNADAVSFVQAAISAAKEASGDPRAGLYLPHIFQQWAMHDTGAALAFAKSLPDAKERDGRLFNVLEGWAERDPKETLKHFGEFAFGDALTQMSATQSLAERLAEKDPALATEFAQAQPAGQTRTRAVGAVAQKLLSSDPESALALIATIPAEESYGLVYPFYEAWAESNPLAVIQHCSERLNAMAPGSQTRKNLADFLENNFLTTALERDPRATAEFLAGQAESLDPALLASLLRRWTYLDSVAAIGWAEELPEGVTRDHAFAGLAEGRASQSLNETVDWLRKLPKDSTYPAAIQGFASAVFSQDPDGALSWIRTIASPAEQQRRLQSAWLHWANSDLNDESRNRTAAENWRDSSPELSEQERRSLVLPSEKPE